jgi:threonine aldolase
MTDEAISEPSERLRFARHANACARRLESGLREVKGVEILAPTEANAVFAQLPDAVLEGLRKRGWRFYTFIGSGGGRFMCSWETSEEDIAALLCDLRQLAS